MNFCAPTNFSESQCTLLSKIRQARKKGAFPTKGSHNQELRRPRRTESPHVVGPRLIFLFLDFRLSMEINPKGSEFSLFAFFLGKPTRHKAGEA